MLETLQKYHEDGLVYNQVHPTLDLTIWNYTEKVQYEGLWDEITLMCRGLVTNSKGQFSSVTAPNVTVVWVGDSLVASGYTAGEYRKVLLVMSGFSNAGSYGKLMGPDGNTVDTETFLSDLTITSTPGTSPWSAVTGNLLFRVV